VKSERDAMWGHGIDFKSLHETISSFEKVKTEEGSKAKSIFLIIPHRRLI
jgi:hypothetical protein